jgi:hypothetical protein
MVASGSRRARLTHERVGRLLAGAAVIASLAAGWLLSPWCLLCAGGTALNLVISALTDRCPVKTLLIRLGLPGERDLGRAEAEYGEVGAVVPVPAVAVEADRLRPGAGRLAGRLGVGIN